jgi:hypothetical protein
VGLENVDDLRDDLRHAAAVTLPTGAQVS